MQSVEYAPVKVNIMVLNNQELRETDKLTGNQSLFWRLANLPALPDAARLKYYVDYCIHSFYLDVSCQRRKLKHLIH